jgi:ferredoxin-NADP reductase
MAEKRVATITSWEDVSSGLSIFRLQPQGGTSFPDYKAGQYIALTRDGCRLTAKVKDEAGNIRYEPATNEDGTPKIGAVTHSYSIASAPFETQASSELEIYITLEKLGGGRFGRFTESLYKGGAHVGDTLGYVDRIVGNFTLDHRAPGADHVVMVGTGTGLAPFVGMMKQVAHEAKGGRPSPAAYTLIHANRTLGELGYDRELRNLEAERIAGFDFTYVPSVSRPGPGDAGDPKLCQGRANNLLRLVLGLPTREEEEGAVAATKPRLGSGVDGAGLRARMPAGQTTVLTCGNADLMEDIKRICEKAGFKFEMEEW